MSIAAIKTTLNTVERWCQPNQKNTERNLEALLRAELFQQSLGFSPDSAVSQTQIDQKRSGVADIALKVVKNNKKRWIFVEVKKPRVKTSDQAIRQAGKYLARVHARRAIITNGDRWLFVTINSKPGTKYQYYAVVLLDLVRGKAKSVQRRALERALSRCFPRNIDRFFLMLERISALDKAEIQRRMQNKPPLAWSETIAGAVKESFNERISKGDGSVLRFLTTDFGLFQQSLLGAYRSVSFSQK